jgi:hypothetical protein
MGLFRPTGDDRTSPRTYEVPAEILEDAELLRAWVRKSVSAATRKAGQKRSRRRRITEEAASEKLPASNKASAAGKQPARRKIGGLSRRGGRAGRKR